MRLTDLTTWVVNVPYRTPFVSSFEVRRGTTRTVVRLRTDEGLIGWGETMHGSPVAALVEKLFADYRGTDPFAVEAMAQRLAMVPFFHGYVGYCALAALEMACHDLIGKATGQPLVNLIGGAVRGEVPVTYVLTPPEGEVRAGALVEETRAALAAGGYRAVKLKGSADPAHDVGLLEALRAAFPDLALRVDPNGHWPVAETVRLAGRLEALDLEYLEDPCWGLEAMAQVRARVRVPLCTNMCVVTFDDVAPALRLGAVDIVHGDVHKWGGIAPTRRLAGVCATLGWGMNLHSGGELGLSTAAHLHVAAATPQIRYPIDTVYPRYADDILPTPLPLAGGVMRPPLGPGLGVAPDEDRLRHYARRHATEGDLLT
jgi:glucarate dehydratase